MNHFLLPGETTDHGQGLRYGLNAMELLINSLLKRGAKTCRLEAKIFGGADMLSNNRNIGAHNARFALWFLENEGISCVSQNIGGNRGRKLRYWPQTGHAQQMFLPDNPLPLQHEALQASVSNGADTTDSGEITFL